MSCGVDHRHGLDPELLWLWYRPAATVPIGPLAWELPYAVGAALEKGKKTKKINNNNNNDNKIKENIKKLSSVRAGCFVSFVQGSESTSEHLLGTQ